MSSGTRISSTIRPRGCDNCGWDGLIDLVTDPEAPFAGWECPTCLTSYDTTEAVFYDGPDPDDARDRELDF